MYNVTVFNSCNNVTIQEIDFMGNENIKLIAQSGGQLVPTPEDIPEPSHGRVFRGKFALFIW